MYLWGGKNGTKPVLIDLVSTLLEAEEKEMKVEFLFETNLNNHILLQSESIGLQAGQKKQIMGKPKRSENILKSFLGSPYRIRKLRCQKGYKILRCNLEKYRRSPTIVPFLDNAKYFKAEIVTKGMKITLNSN
ncbi:MAG: hypothetical protein PVJ84_16250 [Desulfobacteraceae bacterium]